MSTQSAQGFVMILNHMENGKREPAISKQPTLDKAIEAMQKKFDEGFATGGHVYLVDTEQHPIAAWPVGYYTTDSITPYQPDQDWSYPNFLLNGYLVMKIKEFVAKEPMLQILAMLADKDPFEHAMAEMLTPGYATQDELHAFALKDIAPTRFGDTYPVGATQEQIEQTNATNRAAMAAQAA